MGMSLSEFWEFVIDREAWHAVVRGVTKSQTKLSDWTDWKIGFILIPETMPVYFWPLS